MKTNHVKSQQQLATKTLELHRQRRLAGADDSEKSLLTSGFMAVQSLAGGTVSEPAAQQAADKLLAMRSFLPPMAFTLEKVLTCLHPRTEDETDQLVSSILSREDRS